MQAEKAHSKHSWNTPASLYHNFPASVLLLDVCIQNQQAKLEDWPQLFSYNVQEKRDLLAVLAAVRGSSLQSRTTTLPKYRRLTSCKVRMLPQHGAAWNEHRKAVSQKIQGKKLTTLSLSNSSRLFFLLKSHRRFSKILKQKYDNYFLSCSSPPVCKMLGKLWLFSAYLEPA